MAPQRKKAASSRRSTTRKKGMGATALLHTVWKVVAVLVVVSTFAITGYVFGYLSGKKEHIVALHEQRQQNIELKSALQRAQKRTASHEYEQAPPQPQPREKVVEAVPEKTGAKPMVAIIFDDVSFPNDVRNIKALDMTVTMSFLPPSKRHPDSAKLASKEPFYMVHFPLEALSFASEEPDTLHVGDSEEHIEERVRQLKELFPKAIFVNNHTGSKFTADEPSMEKLVYALDREGITFIDSRTTAQTAVPALMKSLHRPYIGRDVFLDHDPDVEEIKKEVKRAVKIAKKYGYAIVIGHPHKKTLKGLRESKEMLSQVELVQMDTLVAHMKR